MIEARQKGFHINPGPQVNRTPLDDDEDLVRFHFSDFSLYGTDFESSQRERTEDDPDVVVNPPQCDFVLDVDVAWIKAQTDALGEDSDLFDIEKYCFVLRLIEYIRTQRFSTHG